VLEFLRGPRRPLFFLERRLLTPTSPSAHESGHDLVSTRAAELARSCREHLANVSMLPFACERLAKTKDIASFKFRNRNRHLVDLRKVESLPHAERIEDVLVNLSADLIAQKVISYHGRRGQPKAGTDWRDLAMLLFDADAFKDFGSLCTVLFFRSETPTITSPGRAKSVPAFGCPRSAVIRNDFLAIRSAGEVTRTSSIRSACGSDSTLR